MANELNQYGSQSGTYVAAKKFGPTSSFSGADMIVQFAFPGSRPITVGTATNVTYSTFREIAQLRVLGRVSPKGITRGGRTIGGTIIFTAIEQHSVNEIMDQLKSVSPFFYPYDKIKPDELPPFDIIVTFANEYGQSAKMVIYGVTIVDDGMVFSIEDDLTETTMTYIARDIDVMRGPIDSKMGMYVQEGQSFRDRNEPIGRFHTDPVESSENYQKWLLQQKRKYEKWSGT